MSLKINGNITGMRVIRTLSNTERNLADSLLRLSSGFKINKGADNPAGLVISEQLRGQVSGINQAIANSELAATMVQTAEGGLNEINNILLHMRQLTMHAVNQGANDPMVLHADQNELATGLEAIAHIARNTQFGERNLLDGTTGVLGEALGEGLDFLSATKNTKSSGPGGYAVEVLQAPTRAFMEGTYELEDEDLPDLTITLYEGGKSVKMVGRESDTIYSFYGRLSQVAAQNGLDLTVFLTPDNTLFVRHNGYGKKNTFQASSSIEGALSEEENVMEKAMPGVDIVGTIKGVAARGQGQILFGIKGDENTDGLAVRYSGPLVLIQEEGPDGLPIYERQPREGIAGVVHVYNNALNFQVGPNPGQFITQAMPLVEPRFLGRGVGTDSKVTNLAQVDLTTPMGAKDGVRIVDSAINEVTLMRGKMGAFQRHGLESNINNLRVTAENLMAAESTIRDTDVAKELAEYTRQKIMFEMGTAMAAQAGQVSRRVIDLIG